MRSPVSGRQGARKTGRESVRGGKEAYGMVDVDADAGCWIARAAVGFDEGIGRHGVRWLIVLLSWPRVKWSQ